MRRSIGAAVVALALATPAEASDWWILAASPTAAPGQFILGFGAEATSVQVPRFRYGDRYSSSSFNPSLGPVFDESRRALGPMPQIEGAYGLPQGLAGMPAEVFARFAFSRASTDFGGTFVRTGLPTMVFPFVNAVTMPISGSVFTGLDITSNPTTLEIERRLVSYDGSVGLRTRMSVGRTTVMPWIDIGFQRVTLQDRIQLSIFRDGPGGAPITVGGPTRAEIDGDYYRFSLGAAAAHPLDPVWSVFGSVYGSLDVVRADLTASSTLTLYNSMFNFFETGTASASDRRTIVSGRVAVRGGIAYQPLSNVSVVLAGGFQYLGAVPNVIYPTHANFNAGTHNNGSGPARIGFVGQLNYSAGAGLKITF